MPGLRVTIPRLRSANPEQLIQNCASRSACPDPQILAWEPRSAGPDLRILIWESRSASPDLGVPICRSRSANPDLRVRSDSPDLQFLSCEPDLPIQICESRSPIPDLRAPILRSQSSLFPSQPCLNFHFQARVKSLEQKHPAAGNQGPIERCLDRTFTSEK